MKVFCTIHPSSGYGKASTDAGHIPYNLGNSSITAPGLTVCLAAMRQAGCKTTIEEVGKAPDFVDISFRFHPYMRRRLSLKRVSHMLDLPEDLF